MMCVESIFYSVLVNDETTSLIYLRRGLRKGDPLSLYLFILCIKGVSMLMRQTYRGDRMHGVQSFRNEPIMSHLLVVNGCFLFCKANCVEDENMKEIQTNYGEAYEKLINF